MTHSKPLRLKLWRATFEDGDAYVCMTIDAYTREDAYRVAREMQGSLGRLAILNQLSRTDRRTILSTLNVRG